MNKRIELLAPAGDLDRAKIAINFNANAIYFGGKKYSLRARANNFTISEIKKVIAYAHKNKVKVYIVVNIICHNSMILGFKKYLDKIMQCNPDGLICADPYIMDVIHKYYPKIAIHVSTQQSITNSKAALFWKTTIGAKRVITAREVDLQNLKLMIKNLKNKMDVEYFIHGALCVSYSGHCMMSNIFSLRDPNVGGCAQSCRWYWKLYDKNKKIISNKFMLSAKDLCHISNLKKLIKIGVNSLKIEGRMKSSHYVATICNNYAHALNDYYHNCLTPKRITMYLNDLAKAANRLTSIGWFNGNPNNNQMIYNKDEKNSVLQNFVFIIKKKISKLVYEIISKNYLNINNKLEVFGSSHDLITNIKIKKIFDVDNQQYVEIINKPMRLYRIELDCQNLKAGDFGRVFK